MRTPFKMKGYSYPGISPLRDGMKTKGTLKTNIGSKLNKTNHPVTPPTEEESKKSKGKLSKTKGISTIIDKELIKDQLNKGTFWVTPNQKNVVKNVVSKVKSLLKR